MRKLPFGLGCILLLVLCAFLGARGQAEKSSCRGCSTGCVAWRKRKRCAIARRHAEAGQAKAIAHRGGRPRSTDFQKLELIQNGRLILSEPARKKGDRFEVRLERDLPPASVVAVKR